MAFYIENKHLGDQDNAEDWRGVKVPLSLL